MAMVAPTWKGSQDPTANKGKAPGAVPGMEQVFVTDTWLSLELLVA